MEIIAALELVEKVLAIASQTIPTVAKGIDDVTPFAVSLYKDFTGRQDITDDELNAIEAKVDALREQLAQPLSD